MKLTSYFSVLVRSVAVLSVVGVGSLHMAMAQVLVAPARESQGVQSSALSGVVVEKIEITGNKRIPVATIVSYAVIKVGTRANDENMDETLKALYDTGMFSDVKVTLTGSVLRIEVVENPIINRIAFENNGSFPDDKLSPLLQLRSRQVFTRNKLQNDVDTILQAYRALGRFSATVDPKIIKRSQNRIDLVFVISEGEHTKIDNITFVGNKTFSDGTLKNVVNTSESKWWRFLSTSDTYDPEKLAFDKELLRNYYLSKGFADVQIKTAVAELSQERDSFFVSYSIKEGRRYKYRNFSITSNLPDVDTEVLKSDITLKAGDWYNSRDLDKDILKLTTSLNNMDYPFVDVTTRIRRDRKTSEIDVEFILDPAPRQLLERIEIRGNVRTRDDVIRREIQMVEGDPMNQARYSKSRENIERLGYFQSVETEIIPGSDQNHVVMVVNIEEKSTGDITIGGGYSSDDGTTLEFGLKERNLTGTGRELDLRIATGGRVTAWELGLTEPYFMGRDWTVGGNLYVRESKTRKSNRYAYTRTGLTTNISYDIDQDWEQTVGYQYDIFKLGFIGSQVSNSIRNGPKEVETSSAYHSTTYYQVDSRFKPTEGYSITFGNSYAGLGGDVKLFNTTVDGSYYYRIDENSRLLLNGMVGVVNGYGGQKVRPQDRFSLGGYNLRGFRAGEVGARTHRDVATGGTQIMTATAQVYFENLLPKETGIEPYTFVDTGRLSKPDQVIQAGGKTAGGFRASAGLGWKWDSPVGVMEFSFARPLKKERWDRTQTFRFDVGVRF